MMPSDKKEDSPVNEEGSQSPTGSGSEPAMGSDLQDSSLQEKYRCPHPDCCKSFTRMEHLSRHKLNHWPKEIFKCSYVFPGANIPCGKTFVRKDLLVRHEKRHAKVNNKLNKKYSRLKGKHPTASAALNSKSQKIEESIMLPMPYVQPLPSTDRSAATRVASPDKILENTNGSTTISTYANNQSMNSVPGIQFTPAQADLNTSRNFDRDLTLNISPYDQNKHNLDSHDVNNGGTNYPENQGNHTRSPQYPPNSPTVYSALGFGPGTQVGTPYFLPNMVRQASPLNTNANNLSNGIEYNSKTNDATTEPLTKGIAERFSVSTSNDSPSSQQYLLDISQQQDNNLMNPAMKTPQGFLSRNTSAINMNTMQDLFSFDGISMDPLQIFMQELSFPHPMESGQSDMLEHYSSVENLSSVKSLTDGSDNSVSSYQYQLLRNNSEKMNHDFGCYMVKDNVSVQKSNVNELRRQTSNASSPKLKVHDQSTKSEYRRRLMISMKSTPSFFDPDPRKKYEVSQDQLIELQTLIPELKATSVEKIYNSIKSYWYNFQPQYGLLHKPSFNIEEQPSILLLALIMTGASFLGPEYCRTIGDPICTPLRWMIFSHGDFQPPAKTYIIQSLLLLEGYEKTSTDRYYHERSYLHHGTTIQLLRRTPSLGGHPLMTKSEGQGSPLLNGNSDDDLPDIEGIYRKWIDFEMLKRVALYAFYMDVTHAVIFGYSNIFISCNQIQLTLPCSDDVWESYDLSYEKLVENGFGRKKSMRPSSFLSTLKNVIKVANKRFMKLTKKKTAKNTNTRKEPHWNINSAFGKKLILAGLISIMFQCQEEIGSEIIPITLRTTYDDTIRKKGNWKELISFAMNYWHSVISGDCSSKGNCLLPEANLLSDRAKYPNKALTDDPSFDNSLNLIGNDLESTCKVPVFHIAQISLKVFHHDYYIFAGAPWRMNVRLGEHEYAVVTSRVVQFAKDPYVGGVAIVYAFQHLFEIFLKYESASSSETHFVNYDVNRDYILTRPGTIAMASILIWSYQFVLYGPEAHSWSNSGTERDDPANALIKESYTPQESFECYLSRMFNFLYIKPTNDPIAYQEAIWEKALLLEKIPNMQNVAGMMLYMRDLFSPAYWEVGREFSRLFNNCYERSIGKNCPTCYDMYDV